MSAEALLDAGAVLPADTAVTKDDTVDTLTARAYRHPALDDRVVVRLISAQLGPAEDLSLEFLAFGAAERVDEVGLVRQRALGFPAWALVHDPANGHHALALVKDIERLARIAKSRVGPANDGFVALGERLARAVPHFLPTFYEEAGRAFLAADSASYAAMMFGRARDAERGFGLTIDEERTHAVFLEFALAGALTAKALSAHARDLAGRCAPDVAYERFRRLCVERTRGGLPPYAGLHTDLRRLAKASGLDPLEADRRVLAELIDAPVILRAPAAFWTAYQSSLSKLAAADPALRGRLLGMFPTNCSDEAWLTILTDSGAVEALTGAGGPGPADGPAGWLTRFAAHREARSWRETKRLPALLDLVERMAPRLIADGEPVTLCGSGDDVDLDLLDACLAHGVPVADPDSGARLPVGHWFDDATPGRRDLAALAGDARFRQLLGGALERSLGSAHRPDLVARLLDVAGLRVVLHDWLHDVATMLPRHGLPTLGGELDRLMLAASPAGFAVNPEAVQLATGLDLGPVLGRTLRAGVLDEFGWPAWDEAVGRLTAPKADEEDGKDDKATPVALTRQWPVLLLRKKNQLWAVGPDRIELEHEAQIPKGQRSWLWRQVLRFVDGALLVCWDKGPDRAGYWTNEPDDVFVVPDDAFQTSNRGSLPLPGGGRTFGAAPLRVGDRSEQHAGRVVSDGTAFWVLTRVEKKLRWREFDPATGTVGRASLPQFFEAGAVDGAKLELDDCWLYPASGSPEAGPLGQRDGLLGWRVRLHADDTLSGEGIDGHSFTLPGELRNGVRGVLRGDLSGAVQFPGSTETYGVLHLGQWRSQSITLCAADGFTIGRYDLLGDAEGTIPKQRFARGTVLIPPLPFWSHLRPRDPRGSAALRALTDEQAGSLLAAAAGLDKAATRELVARELPEVTHPALVAGVAGVVRVAAKRTARLRDFATVLSGQTVFPKPPKDKSGKRATKPDSGAATQLSPALAPASDKALYAALGSVLPYCYERGHSAIRLFEAAAAALAAPEPPSGPVRIKDVDVDWYRLLSVLPVAVHRAIAPFTPVEHREALLALLDAYARSGLAAPSGRMRTLTLTADQKKLPDVGAVILVGSRRLLVTNAYAQTVYAYDYAPDGQFGPVPGYAITAESALPLPAEPARLVELIRERGVPPLRPELASQLATAAGVSRAEALLLLAGLPSAQEAGDLGVSVALQQAARQSWSLTGQTSDLLALLLPDDVAALWSDGPRLDRVAAWQQERHGPRTPAPDELIEAVQQSGIARELPAAELLHGITNAATCRWLTPGASEIEPETVAVQLARALPWLSYHLPADHPLRENLPTVARAARTRLVEPDCRVDVGAIDQRKVPRLIAALGGEAVTGPEWIQVGAVEIEAQDDWRTIRLRPQLLAGPDDPTLTVLRGHVEDYDTAVFAALRALLGDSLATTVASGQSAVDTGYAHDPARSAPQLVTAAAERLGLGTDAATVYLQLLALPDPTDRNIARWTGWKPARLAAARTELAGTDLVVSAKRARAGRSLFLPGGWLELRAPHLPVERWKIPMLTLDEDGRPALSIVVPIAPPPRIFELAWQRILDGDTPRFDELTTTERRR